MRLYSGMSEDFIRDTTHNHIAERLREAFFAYYRYNPSPGEVNSWRNSLRAMKDVLDLASLNDHGILLEYQLPLTSRRIDCMVCGRDEGDTDQAVIVELKQWERCEPADPDKVVRSWIGGRQREVLHPSVQVEEDVGEQLPLAALLVPDDGIFEGAVLRRLRLRLECAGADFARCASAERLDVEGRAFDVAERAHVLLP